MVLGMARPWKHPRSGVYWFRKRVPDDLRALLGKLEEKQSLRTKDPIVARKRHAEALAEVEGRWANLRAGARTFSEREAHLLAAPIGERWITLHRNNPSQQTTWRTELGERLWADRHDDNDSAFTAVSAPLDKDAVRLRDMESWCLSGARECLVDRGFVVDDAAQLTVAKAIAAAVQNASLILKRYEKGEFGIGSLGDHLLSTEQRDVTPLTFGDLCDGWAKERKPAQKTVYEWKRVLRQLAEYLGHDNARAVTSDDMVRWKDSMVEAGLRARTIQNAKLAPVRAILQWGVDNKKLKTNPAERINIAVKTIATEKIRSFTDEEAREILMNALKQKDTVRRWIPWLGAYSGARVSELCQLRAEDVLQIDGIWCMKFDPEAGPLKNTSSERTIPLHPGLLESGFLEFVKGIKSGPLFPHLKPDKFGKRGGNGTKVIGRWVRSLGITDTRLSPSHSWRHRIKTLGRRHGLAQDILEAITGHGRKSVADSYGEFPMEALHRELTKIPALQFASD